MGLQEHTSDDQTMQQWYTVKQVITITVVFVTDIKFIAGRVKVALLLSVWTLVFVEEKIICLKEMTPWANILKQTTLQS